MAPHSILYKPPTFPSRSPSDVGLKQNPGAAPESGGNHGSLACLLPCTRNGWRSCGGRRSNPMSSSTGRVGNDGVGREEKAAITPRVI
ncbi:hypothetical protein OPV22_012298 [Ensete ventricosum]|uniref:Uncharacterized protein n=1 Tax=Ensete ventricosum TaxID=4639 RepID=A0AAV8R2S8_ENSVE|nr:hypothetical protein OPV22_012298 [Ensete ventricosum]